MHISSKEKPWGKPFTYKRYLHAPLSENIVTSWPSSMVLIGEIKEGRNSHASVNGRRDQSSLPSSAVMFTINGKTLPWREVKYKTRKDGYPIHSFSHSIDGIKYVQECFCDNERVSTAYIKIAVENASEKEQTFAFGAIVRTGPEFDLIGCIEPDGYSLTEQNKNQWQTLPKFKRSKGKLTDGVYTLRFSESHFFIERNEDDLSTFVTLSPNQKQTFYFSFTRSLNTPLRYSEAKEETESFWKKELAKAKYKPKGLDQVIFNNFLVQLLQMFNIPHGENYVLFRQGGIQRYIWPTEAVKPIKALAKIGGYENYIDKTLSTYFDVLQIKEGENEGQVTNFGIGWGSIPGSVLESFAYGALASDVIYNKYYDDAMKTLRWIEKQRESTKKNKEHVSGLFPPWRPSDYGKENQVWGSTDLWTIEGYSIFLDMAKKKKAPDLKEIQSAYDDYYNCIKVQFDKCALDAEGKKEWIVPRDAHNDPELEKELIPQYINFSHAQCEWLMSGFAGFDTPLANKIFEHLKSLKAERGHYTPCTPPASVRFWYTSFGEERMFYYFASCKNKEKEMKQIVDCQLKYATTSEYYMVERFCDHDGFYAPWSPNSSAMGRLIGMCFTLYGEEKL